MSGLPPSWVETKLGDAIAYGTSVKAEPTEIPDDAWLLELEDIEKDTSKLLARVTFAQRRSKSTKNRFSAGDVLYGKLRPYLNKVLLADREGFCSTEIVPLKATPEVDSGYLFHWLRHPRFLDYVTGISHGLNMPRLGTAAGRQAPFILAPIGEQRRVARKLDALLTKLDACRERLDRVPQILNKFRDAVLEAAVSGRLTEEWRGVQETNLEWRRVALADVAEARLGKMLDRAKNQGVLTPYLRNINVRWFGFDLSDVKELKIGRSEASTLSVEQGDVLICEGGEPGRCAVWRGPNAAYIYQKALHRVRVGPSAKPDWICYALKHEATMGSLADNFTGTTIKHFTGVALAKFQLNLPPVAEQVEAIRRVDVLFALADRLQRRHDDAVTRVGELTPSVLAKAFRGELVPQNPNDEPAERLLSRIRSAPSPSRKASGREREGQPRPRRDKALR